MDMDRPTVAALNITRALSPRQLTQVINGAARRRRLVGLELHHSTSQNHHLAITIARRWTSSRPHTQDAGGTRRMIL